MTKEDVQKKVAKLQMSEQRLQSYAMQKQTFQGQLLEIENALLESKDSEEVFKIYGQIMVKADKEKLTKELNDKKEILSKKISEIEKQESKLREEVTPLQEELMGSLNNEG